MTRKRFTIKTACPQCGCSFVQVLSQDEIQEKYGEVPNVSVDCSECLRHYETEMQNACPEWDETCRLKE